MEGVGTTEELPPFCPSDLLEDDFRDPAASSSSSSSSSSSAAASSAAGTADADPWSDLHPTARTFLRDLGLPSVHPSCTTGSSAFASAAFATAAFGSNNGVGDGLPPPPHAIPPGDYSTVVTIGDLIGRTVTFYSQVAPALLAMSELWLRLFAFVLAPMSAFYLVTDEVFWHHRSKSSSETAKSKSTKSGGGTNDTTTAGNKCNKQSKWRHHLSTSSSIFGLASSAVLVTDSLYVHEYGRTYGAFLFLLLSVLSTRAWLRRKMRWTVLLVLLLIKVVATFCLLRSGGGGGEGGEGPATPANPESHPGIDLPTVQEGLYYSRTNPTISSIVAEWPDTYQTYAGTPWLPTGDAKTGIPFLINSAPPVKYVRVWVTNHDDGEHVALDVAFPPANPNPNPNGNGGNGNPNDNGDGGGGGSIGTHSSSNPVYLILHGLNGGSNEEYVREFVARRTLEGSTCIVMVARGLMDTPIMGWNVFHGARVSDVHVAAGAVKKALGSDQILAGVGYSMGAIILANYVARSGSECHLNAAMSVSGGLDMREQINFYRSMRLWQPMLAKELRDTFIVGKFEARYRHRLTEDQYLELLRSAHISDIDTHGVVTYNGFRDLMHYYSEMSANGDHRLHRHRSVPETADPPPPADGGSDGDDDDGGDGAAARSSSMGIGRLSNVSVPFCVLHALDDPLVTWRTVAKLDPELLVESGSGNLILLLTKSGGHVGWPLGLIPSRRGWEWMNNAVRDFVNSVDAVLMKKGAVEESS